MLSKRGQRGGERDLMNDLTRSSTISLGLLITAGIILFFLFLLLPQRTLAYTAGCIYNQSYTPEQIQHIAASPGVTALISGISQSVPPQPCTQADKEQVIEAIRTAYRAINSDISIVNDPNATPEQKAAAQARLEANMPAATGSCGLINWSFQNCIWIPLLSWLGSWFLTAGGGLVLLFGSIFQSLVDLVIIAFQKTLTDFGVLSRVDQWWVFVRNISNVLIIGFFTYIAVALILGLKEYGQKKLIARVLIVAILINFSLLFTKLVIDTSNY